MKRFLQGTGLVVIAAVLGLSWQPARVQADDSAPAQNLAEVTIFVTGMM